MVLLKGKGDIDGKVFSVIEDKGGGIIAVKGGDGINSKMMWFKGKVGGVKAKGGDVKAKVGGVIKGKGSVGSKVGSVT